MGKVIIRTFSFVNNCGALFQTYALIKHLESCGEVVAIEPRRPFRRRNIKLFYGWRLKEGITRAKLFAWLSQWFRALAFHKFRRKYIGVYEINKGCISGKVTYIVGSDQVWNSKYGESALEYYLLADVISADKKLSYAASKGKSEKEVRESVMYSKHLRSFNTVLVRDTFTGAALPEGINWKVVCDPSLLVDWKQITFDSKIRLEKSSNAKRIVAVYGYSELISGVIKSLRKENNSYIVGMGMEHEVSAGDLDFCLDCKSPAELLNVFKKSSIIVTKSYHGMMLGLSLKKDLIVVKGDEKTWCRLDDLIKYLNLSISPVLDKSSLSAFEHDTSRYIYSQPKEDAHKLERFVRESKGLLLEALSS